MLNKNLPFIFVLSVISFFVIAYGEMEERKKNRAETEKIMQKC